MTAITSKWLSGADVLNSGTIDTSTTDAYAMADETNVGRIILLGENVTSARSESNDQGGIVKVLGDTAIVVS